jgi:hypothetical protein
MSKEKLRENLDVAEWAWLKPHALRDAVIVVNSSLDLIGVGHEIAENNFTQIQAWIAQGLIAKPTADQIKTWDQNPTLQFESLIVQPYVLICLKF